MYRYSSVQTFPSQLFRWYPQNHRRGHTPRHITGGRTAPITHESLSYDTQCINTAGQYSTCRGEKLGGVRHTVSPQKSPNSWPSLYSCSSDSRRLFHLIPGLTSTSPRPIYHPSRRLHASAGRRGALTLVHGIAGLQK